MGGVARQAATPGLLAQTAGDQKAARRRRLISQQAARARELIAELQA